MTAPPLHSWHYCTSRCVRSALASLGIDDVITKNYCQVLRYYDRPLRSASLTQMSKAEALKEAQKVLINQNNKIHPLNGTFILVGNWL